MKKILLFAIVMAGTVSLQAQGLQTPPPSTAQTIKQGFGLGNIELSYSRPSLRGRTVGTDLAPFGKVWRTGANAATTIQFSEDVKIGGTDVKAGKYGLLSIPNTNQWTIIITKDLNINQPSLYNQANDVVRVTAPAKKSNEKTETFTIDFANVTNSSVDVRMAWGNIVVALPVTVNTDEKVMKQISEAFNKDPKPYFAAAQYYYDNGKDISKAKEWVDQATADPANANAFWVHLLKARIYQKAGDKVGAKASAEKTISLATTAKNDDYVKMAQDLIKSL